MEELKYYRVVSVLRGEYEGFESIGGYIEFRVGGGVKEAFLDEVIVVLICKG